MQNLRLQQLLLYFLLVPFLGFAQEKTYTHIHKDGGHHTDKVINYKTWNDVGWWAKTNGNTFTHSRKRDFTNSHQDVIINYISWNKSKWTAKVDGNIWIHAPNGDFSKAHQSKIINYLTPSNEPWTATFESYQTYKDGNTSSASGSGNELTGIPLGPIVGSSSGPIFNPPPPFPMPGSLNDALPGEPTPFLLDDLGYFDWLVYIGGQWDLPRAVSALAHQALDNYSKNLNQYKAHLPGSIRAGINTGNLREYIRTHSAVKNAVNGLLFALIVNTISNTNDQSAGAKAIRTWSAKIYKDLNVVIAKNTLREYNKWKVNPCAYASCPTKLGSLLSAPKPPMKLIAENGFNSSFQNATSIAGAVGIAGGAIGVAVGAGLLANALSVGVGSTAVSLFTTFGGTAGVAIGSAATVWTGPGAIIVIAIAAGILEAINVSAAADAERKLIDRVEMAKNENVNIISVAGDKEQTNLLFTAFINISNLKF